MIIEWLASVGSSVAAFVASMFPEFVLPDWFVNFGPGVQTILNSAHGMGVWMDFNMAGVVAGAVLSTYVVGFIIKLLLRAGSHVPQFGGAG